MESLHSKHFDLQIRINNEEIWTYTDIVSLEFFQSISKKISIYDNFAFVDLDKLDYDFHTNKI